MWSVHKNKKLSGYYDTTKYKTLAKAMNACIGSKKCKGVTEEGSANYRLNTKNTPSSASGKTAYIQGSPYTLTSGVFWTEVEDARLPLQLGKNKYKTLEKAKAACKAYKKALCKGVTEKNGKYTLHKTDKIKYSSVGKVYLMGGSAKGSYSYEMTFKDHTWDVQGPAALDGQIGKTSYKTRDEALTACAANSKCNGVTKKPTNEYVLNTGSSASPTPGAEAYVKAGKAKMAEGKSWTVKSGYTLNGIQEKEYTNRKEALVACSKKGSCKGVVKTNTGKFKLANGSKVSKKSGYKLYLKGSTALSYFDYTWTQMSGYTLSEPLNKKKYPNLQSALKVCAKNIKCRGVTKISANKYRLYKDTQPSVKKGRVVYLQGGIQSITRSVTHGGLVWILQSPYKFTGDKIGSANTRDKALKKCHMSKRCKGVTQVTSTYFTLHSSLDKQEQEGSMIYTRRGSQITNSGFVWGYQSGWELEGYDNDTKYKTAKAAFRACTASDTCTGVTYEKAKVYRTNTGMVPKRNSDRKMWIKGMAFKEAVIYKYLEKENIMEISSFTFGKSEGFVLYNQKGAKMDSIDDAVYMCGTKPKCKGVNEDTVGKGFYMAFSSRVRQDSRYNAYVKGGKNMKLKKFSLGSDGYIWNFAAPFRATNCYGRTRTLTMALRVCAAHSHCNSITKKNGEDGYLVCKGSTQEPDSESQVWIKQGNGVEYEHNTNWASYEGHKLTGYQSKKVYKTKATAMAACSKEDECLGVTQEGASNYRLNTGNTPFKQKGMNCWIQSGFFVTARGKTKIFHFLVWQVATYKGRHSKPPSLRFY